MADLRKARMVSMRMTEKQYKRINDMADRIKQSTGFRITRASIMLKLMELGLSKFEQEFPEAKLEKLTKPDDVSGF